MQQRPLDEQMLRRVRDDMCKYFTEEESALIKASADELVSVSVDTHFQLRSVSIQRIGLDDVERERLEGALLRRSTKR